MDKWVGKVALVTGASSGIGAAVTIDLVKAGVITIGLARRVEKVESLRDHLTPEQSKNLHSFKGSVSDVESVKSLFVWIEEKFGGINILVNNAGTATKGLLLNDSDNFDDINEVVGTNLLGLLYCTRSAYKLLKKNDDTGYIINIGSILGHNVPFYLGIPPPHNAYPSTKYGVVAAGEVLRQELVHLKNRKVRVTTISPGLVRTEIIGKSGVCKEVIDAAPILDPVDISQAIIFVLSTPSHVEVKDIVIKPVGEFV